MEQDAGRTPHSARRYDDAIAQLRKSPIEMGVTNQRVYFAMALAQARKGRFDQALATLDRATGRPQTAIQSAAYRAYIDHGHRRTRSALFARVD